MGKLVYSKQSCPKCGSSDALHVYEDEGILNGYCFSNNCYLPNYEGDTVTKVSNITKSAGLNWEQEYNEAVTVRANILKDRGISQAACNFYGIRVKHSPSTGVIEEHLYPYYKDGELVAFKARLVESKDFFVRGNGKDLNFFGQSLAGGGGKFIIVVEGELDCAAAWDMLQQRGKDYRVVSVPNGAQSNMQKHVQWLEGFEKVVIAFDNDEAGQKGAKALAKLLSPGKAFIAKLEEKDPNEYLKLNKAQEFLKVIWNAQRYGPTSIVSGVDTWDRVKDPNLYRPPSIQYPAAWSKLNDMVYGIRKGELDTWTSGTGMGKSTVFRELQYHLINNTEDNIGVISLEEPLEETVTHIMGVHLQKRLLLPDVVVSEEERRSAWEATSGTGRIHFHDTFGSLREDDVLGSLRYLAVGLNCKYLMLDHLSIVVSEYAMEGGERERIDTIMTKLKALTVELGIWIGLIVHLRKVSPGTKPFEEGAIPSMDDLRGSGGIKQLSNNIFAVSRNQKGKTTLEQNTCHLHVLKCRLTGRLGPADTLLFNENTGRMDSVSDMRIF